jgi:ribosomal protein L18E
MCGINQELPISIRSKDESLEKKIKRYRRYAKKCRNDATAWHKYACRLEQYNQDNQIYKLHSEIERLNRIIKVNDMLRVEQLNMKDKKDNIEECYVDIDIL